LITTWATILLGLVNLITSLYSYLEKRKLITEAEQKLVEYVFRKQADEIKKATAARDAARTASKRVPDGQSLPDDGFKRD
jgi:hypothetical protein